MSGMFLESNHSEIQNIIKNFEGSKKFFDVASKIAILKTVNWIKDTAIVQIQESTKVPKAIVSARAKEYVKNGNVLTSTNGATGKVWLGTYRISFIRLGAKEVKGGVQAGNTFIKDAFIAKLRDGASEGVYKRKGKAKFPVIGFKKVISKDVENVFKNDILEKVNNKLLENLKEELSGWALNKNS